jgi:hypothetical protein
MTFHSEAEKALAAGAEINDILTSPVREQIAGAKFIREENLGEFERLEKTVAKAIADLIPEEPGSREAKVAAG